MFSDISLISNTYNSHQNFSISFNFYERNFLSSLFRACSIIIPFNFSFVSCCSADIVELVWVHLNPSPSSQYWEEWNIPRDVLSRNKRRATANTCNKSKRNESQNFNENILFSHIKRQRIVDIRQTKKPSYCCYFYMILSAADILAPLTTYFAHNPLTVCF